MEVVASLSQGRTAAAQYNLFTHNSVPVIFEPPCTIMYMTGQFIIPFYSCALLSVCFLKGKQKSRYCKNTTV